MLTAADFTIGEIIVVPMDLWNMPLLDGAKFHYDEVKKEEELQIIGVNPVEIIVQTKMVNGI